MQVELFLFVIENKIICMLFLLSLYGDGWNGITFYINLDFEA